MATTPSIFPKIHKITTPQTPNEYNGQFKATQLWNDIIWMLKKNVTLVRKRRLKKRIIQTCFTGADAVNTVLEVLQDESFSSSVKEVSREKSVKLCQAFLDSRVFQAVSSKDEDKFEDSNSKYYKFVDDSDSDSDTESNSSNSKCLQDTSMTSITSTQSEKISIAEKFRINQDLEPDLTDGVISNPLVINQRGQIVQELLGLGNSKLKHSTPELRRGNLSPCNLFKRRTTHDANAHRDIFTSRVADDILREIALSRLLRLVDLPILDGLLCITYKYKSQPISAFNANFKACRSPLMFGCYDDWTKAALDVLEYVPKGIKVMEAYVTESNEIVQKLKLYQGIIDHYSEVSDPLIPEGFTELVVAILNLIMQRKYFLTIEALQLLLVLLPYSLKDEIEKLIRFMWAVSRENKIVLDEKLSNRGLMEKLMFPVLLRNNILAANQASQIVMFVLDNHDEVFLVPRGVQEQADIRITALKTGRLAPILEHPEPSNQFTYCERITEEDFKIRTRSATELGLRDLMNNILDDTQISLKEKKTRLKQLQKEHPEVFNKYFADYL